MSPDGARLHASWCLPAGFGPSRLRVRGCAPACWSRRSPRGGMETYDFLGKDHFFDHEFETSTGSSSPTYSSTETSSASGMESDSGSPATFLDPRGLDPWDEDPLPAGHDYSMAGTIGSAAHGDSGGLEVADPIYWAPQRRAAGHSAPILSCPRRPEPTQGKVGEHRARQRWKRRWPGVLGLLRCLQPRGHSAVFGRDGPSLLLQILLLIVRHRHGPIRSHSEHRVSRARM